MYPAALHRNPTQTVDASQVFERSIIRNQPNIFQKITESWDKNIIKIWNKFVPNRPTIFYLDCCHQRQFYLD